MVLLAPFIIAPAVSDSPQWWPASVRSIMDRSSWETVWAVAEGYYGFGQVEGVRWNPAETNLCRPRKHPNPGASSPWPSPEFMPSCSPDPPGYNRPPPNDSLRRPDRRPVHALQQGLQPPISGLPVALYRTAFPRWAGLTYALILTGLNVLEQPGLFCHAPQHHLAAHHGGHHPFLC